MKPAPRKTLKEFLAHGRAWRRSLNGPEGQPNREKKGIRDAKWKGILGKLRGK